MNIWFEVDFNMEVCVTTRTIAINTYGIGTEYTNDWVIEGWIDFGNYRWRHRPYYDIYCSGLINEIELVLENLK